MPNGLFGGPGLSGGLRAPALDDKGGTGDDSHARPVEVELFARVVDARSSSRDR